MEELLRQAFQLGQQWVHDIEYNPKKEPKNFNEWFNSDEVQRQVKLFCQPPVSGSLQDRLFELANDFAIDKQGDVAVKLHSIHNGLQRPLTSDDKQSF